MGKAASLSAACSDLLEQLHGDPRVADKRVSSGVARAIRGVSHTIWCISELGRTAPLEDLAARLGYAGPVPSPGSRPDIAWCAVLMMRMHDEQSEERITHLVQAAFGQQATDRDDGASAELVRDVLDKLRANQLATNQGRFRTSWTIDSQLSSMAPIELRDFLEPIWLRATPPQVTRPGMPQTVVAGKPTGTPTRYEQPSAVDPPQSDEMRHAFSWEKIQQAIVRVLSSYSESKGVAYRVLVGEVWKQMGRPPQDRGWNERPGDPASLSLFEFRVSRSANTLRAVDVVESERGAYRLTPLGTEVSLATASQRCAQHISLWKTGDRWTAEQWRDWSRDQGGYPDWYLRGGSVEETTVAPVRRAGTPGEAPPTVAEQITVDVVRDYLTVLGTSWKSAQSIAREVAEQIAPEPTYSQRDNTERRQIHEKVTTQLKALEERERADRRRLDDDPAFDMWRLGGIGRVAQTTRGGDELGHASTAPTWPVEWAESVIRVLRDQEATTAGKALLAKELNDAVADDLGLSRVARAVFSLTYPTQYEYQTRIDAVRRFLLEPRAPLAGVLERHEQGKNRLWSLTGDVPSGDELTRVLASAVGAHFWEFANANYTFEPELDDVFERAREGTDATTRRSDDASSEPTQAGEGVATDNATGVGDGPDTSLTNALLETIRAEVSGPGFEYLWALVMAERGYRHVEVRRPGAMGRRGDGGLDILAQGEDEGGWGAWWVQVKNRKDPVVAAEIRDLSGAVRFRGGKAMFASVTGFIEAAEQTAAEHDVDLLGGDEIATWMTDAGVGVRVSGQKMVVDRELLVRFKTENRDALEAVWSEEYYARKKAEGESASS